MKILSREKRASAVIIVKTVYFDCGFWYGTVGASMMIKSCKQFLQTFLCIKETNSMQKYYIKSQE